MQLWHDYRLDVSVGGQNGDLPPCMRLDTSCNGVHVTHITLYATLERIEKIEHACARMRMEIAASEARALQRAEQNEGYPMAVRGAS